MTASNLSHYPSGSRSQPHHPASGTDELWAAAQCREAVSLLERAKTAPPLQLTRDASAAARIVAKMRDQIVEWPREDGSGAEADHRKEALRRLNAALTLMMGVQYPSTGTRRKLVEQARDLLKSILVDGLF